MQVSARLGERIYTPGRIYLNQFFEFYTQAMNLL